MRFQPFIDAFVGAEKSKVALAAADIQLLDAEGFGTASDVLNHELMLFPLFSEDPAHYTLFVFHLPSGRYAYGSYDLCCPVVVVPIPILVLYFFIFLFF
jgi:hypothetical protein